MKILGLVLIAFGLVDLLGSCAKFDLWGDFLQIDLPELLWKYSSYIELIIGYSLFNAGSSSDQEAETEADTETTS